MKIVLLGLFFLLGLLLACEVSAGGRVMPWFVEKFFLFFFFSLFLPSNPLSSAPFP